MMTPWWTPMRNSTLRSPGVSAFRSAIVRWISTAQGPHRRRWRIRPEARHLWF
jgi:hypothetical protein